MNHTSADAIASVQAQRTMGAAPVILFCVEMPLSERDYKRFGFELVESCGYRPLCWDLTRVVAPHVWQSVSGRMNVHRFSGYRDFSSPEEVFREVDALRDVAIFVDLLGCDTFANRLRRRLRTKKAKSVVLKLGVQPGDGRPVAKDVGLLCKRVLSRLPSLPARIRRRMASMNRPRADFLVVGGTAALTKLPHHLQSAHIIPAHSFDYDLSLAHRGKSEIGAVVYLEEWFPMHPDFVAAEEVPYVTEVLYETVGGFLRHLSAEIRATPIVAAHPRSTGQTTQYQCQAIHGRTLELVARASVIVAHSSTAIQFAVIFRKPVIIITTNELERSPAASYIRQTAIALGKKPVNIDEVDVREHNWRAEMCVDEEIYTRFIVMYAKYPDSPELPLWRIIIDRVGNVGTVVPPEGTP